MENDVKKNNSVVDEPTVEFKMITDRIVCGVVDKETEKNLVEISGYDLMINFNMEYINSVEDVEAAIEGISDLFRREIMSKLLEHKKQNI